jgi:hypothetical protein
VPHEELRADRRSPDGQSAVDRGAPPANDVAVKKLFGALVLTGLLTACGATSGTEAGPATTPSPTPPSGFGLGSISGGSVGGADVTAVSVGNQPGYDQFVIEFNRGVPSYSVAPQTNATFTRSPKGDQVTLQGTSGVLIVVHSVTNWSSYTAPTSFHPGYRYLRQVLQVEDFEGYQQWALGVQGRAYARVVALGSPDRLVVDVVGI